MTGGAEVQEDGPGFVYVGKVKCLRNPLDYAWTSETRVVIYKLRSFYFHSLRYFKTILHTRSRYH